MGVDCFQFHDRKPMTDKKTHDRLRVSFFPSRGKWVRRMFGPVIRPARPDRPRKAMVCPTRLRLELDPLRQRQLRRPVDGVGLAPHVSLPRVAAALSSAAGVLLRSEERSVWK